MPKIKKEFVCKQCGFKSLKWAGCCSNCGGWNSFEEEVMKKDNGLLKFSETVKKEAVLLKDVQQAVEQRSFTGISELDCLFGGGIVKGSISLIGGNPGIGKSTLLLQICGSLACSEQVLYVSGEESVRQIKLRADRLLVDSNNLFIVSESDLEIVCSLILSMKPKIVIIDSIQTMSLSEISSAAGSVSQVRECASVLQKISKENEISVVLVGHVTKDGAIAGPKILEHLVDTVLYFEGDLKFSFRVLRVVKNRFGSTNEIAVFEMTKRGLKPVFNPSAILLEGKPKKVPGSCTTSVIEGSRPLFAEIQALVAKASFFTPRRMCEGFDHNRMALIVAVLERRAGYIFGSLDCYVNVVGGINLKEPAVDLAVALALVSSLKNIPICDELIAFGEIGLLGEIRMVAGADRTLIEAKKLGFKKAIMPRSSFEKLEKNFNQMEIIPVDNLKEAINLAFK